MGELARGFHPGGISAPLPASAGGCRVVVTTIHSEERAWIVDFLFPRNLLPGGRVSGHIPPKCFVSRVVSNSVSRRLRSLSPVAEISFSPKCPFPFSGVARFLSKLSFGCDLWRSVSIHSEEWMARFPSVMSVSNSFSRRSNYWLGFI